MDKKYQYCEIGYLNKDNGCKCCMYLEAKKKKKTKVNQTNPRKSNTSEDTPMFDFNLYCASVIVPQCLSVILLLFQPNSVNQLAHGKSDRRSRD
jgi:hypothetical protein